MSGLEIERKFLVHKRMNWKERAVSSSRIRQGYMTAVNTVRVRVRDNQAFLTIKGKAVNGGLTRYEFEKEISLDEAEKLLELCEPGMIDKRRYIIPYEGHTFEVDEFYGENEGLVMAEVEMESEGEHVDLPDFIGPEVTGDHRFYNKQMRKNPFSLWSSTLPEEYR